MLRVGGNLGNVKDLFVELTGKGDGVCGGIVGKQMGWGDRRGRWVQNI